MVHLVGQVDPGSTVVMIGLGLIAFVALMGALYLQRLNERIEATGLIYARFMDDWVILAPTR